MAELPCSIACVHQPGGAAAEARVALQGAGMYAPLKVLLLYVVHVRDTF